MLKLDKEAKRGLQVVPRVAPRVSGLSAPARRHASHTLLATLIEQNHVIMSQLGVLQRGAQRGFQVVAAGAVAPLARDAAAAVAESPAIDYESSSGDSAAVVSQFSSLTKEAPAQAGAKKGEKRAFVKAFQLLESMKDEREAARAFYLRP